MLSVQVQSSVVSVVLFHVSCFHFSPFSLLVQIIITEEEQLQCNKSRLVQRLMINSLFYFLSTQKSIHDAFYELSTFNLRERNTDII